MSEEISRQVIYWNRLLRFEVHKVVLTFYTTGEKGHEVPVFKNIRKSGINVKF